MEEMDMEDAEGPDISAMKQCVENATVCNGEKESINGEDNQIKDDETSNVDAKKLPNGNAESNGMDVDDSSDISLVEEQNTKKQTEDLRTLNSKDGSDQSDSHKNENEAKCGKVESLANGDGEKEHLEKKSESKESSIENKSEDAGTSKAIDSSNENKREKSLADLDISEIETKAEAAARLKATAAENKKYSVMDDTSSSNMRPMAGLLYNIGLDLCREQVYSHLIKVQTKKMTQNKLNNKEIDQLEKLKTACRNVKVKNKAFQMDTIKCKECSFKTESKNILEWHNEFAHGPEEGNYVCTFCKFSTHMPGVFFFHVENKHNRKGRIYMKAATFSCALCPFESNKKSAMTKHKFRCEKNFNTKRNLEPSPTDCDIPILKNKRMMGARHQVSITGQQKMATAPVAQNVQMRSKIAETLGKKIAPKVSDMTSQIAAQAIASAKQATQRAHAQQQQSQQLPSLYGPAAGGMVPMYPPGTTQAQIRNGLVKPTHYAIGNQLYQIVQQHGQYMLRPVQQATHITQKKPVPPPPPQPPPQPVQPSITDKNGAIDLKAALEVARQNVERKQAAAKQEAIKKQQVTKSQKSDQFEICEICGGFVKDRDSLHIHFFWAHKVEINKDIFQQRQPHLICDICKSRFWTFQGLHRHRQMAHNNNPQPTKQFISKANAATYKCYICGEQVLYLAKHLSEAHDISIQEMYKAKKCYVCGIFFNQQKNLENHLVKSHRELLTPNRMRPGKAPFGSVQSPNYSPVPTGLFQNTGSKSVQVCTICNIKFPNLEAFTEHCNTFHIHKCYRCGMKWSSKELLAKHFYDVHRTEQEECQICFSKVTIGRPYVRHLKSDHIKDCSVVLKRISQDVVLKDNEKWLKRKMFRQNRESPKNIITLDESDEEPPMKKPASEKTASPNELKTENRKATPEIMEIDGEEILIQEQEVEMDSSNTQKKSDTISVQDNSKNTTEVEKVTENQDENTESAKSTKSVVQESNSAEDEEKS